MSTVAVLLKRILQTKRSYNYVSFTRWWWYISKDVATLIVEEGWEDLLGLSLLLAEETHAELNSCGLVDVELGAGVGSAAPGHVGPVSLLGGSGSLGRSGGLGRRLGGGLAEVEDHSHRLDTKSLRFMGKHFAILPVGHMRRQQQQGRRGEGL